MQTALTRLNDLVLTLTLVCLAFLAGCGGADHRTEDAEPFMKAIETYLDQHNMALAVKAVKQGPLVDGNRATMTASLTHAELGGAAVTWEFQFEKNPDGSWNAVGHED